MKENIFFENQDKLFKKVEMNNLAIHEGIQKLKYFANKSKNKNKSTI